MSAFEGQEVETEEFVADLVPKGVHTTFRFQGWRLFRKGIECSSFKAQDIISEKHFLLSVDVVKSFSGNKK